MARMHAALLLLASLAVAAAGEYDTLGQADCDPQFRGLDGRTFYFDGVPGKIFNIISEQSHQLNAAFSLGPHKIDTLGKKTNGTFMTSFGLQMFKTKVEMSVDEEGEVTAAINGESVDNQLTANNGFRMQFDEPNGVQVTFEKYRANYGYAITARSPLLELILYSTPKQYDPVAKEIARAYLNLQLAANLEALALTKMHGVLGQNSRYSESAIMPVELSTAFLGEGTDDDYVVSSLFGTDFTYNLFGKQTIVQAGSGEQPSVTSSSAASKMSAARRFLREAESAYAPFVSVVGGLV